MAVFVVLWYSDGHFLQIVPDLFVHIFPPLKFILILKYPNTVLGTCFAVCFRVIMNDGSTESSYVLLFWVLVGEDQD